MQPGNPDMCTSVPQGATFSLCVADDFLCLSSPEPSNASNCQALATTAASDESSTSFPVAAVAVPVAVVGASAVAVAGFWAWRRQHRRRAVTAGMAQQLTDKSKADWALQARRQGIGCACVHERVKLVVRMTAGCPGPSCALPIVC